VILIAPLEDTGTVFSYSRLSEASGLTVDIFTPDSLDVIGFTYDARLSIIGPLGAFKKNHLIRLGLKSSGNIATNPGVESVQTQTTDGLDIKLFKYPIGLRGAAEIETNQDFSIIDATGKADGVIAIPFLKWPLLQWLNLIRISRVIFPPILYGGYTYVYNVKDVLPSDEGDDPYHRINGGFKWNIPFTSSVDLSVDYSANYILSPNENEDNEYIDFVDTRCKIYTDKTRKIATIVGYQKGALPPEYIHVELILAGFEVTMF